MLISRKKIIIFFTIILIIGFGSGFLIGKVSNSKIIINPSPELAHSKDFNSQLFWQVWNTVKKKFVNQPVDDKSLFYGSLEGIVSGLKDPYSVYFNPELNKKFKQELSGKFSGIGIVIGIQNERLTIIAPLHNTPADKAKLRSGDKILAIDKKDASGMSLDEAASLIRGKKGTKVTLTIFRKNWAKMHDIEITRDIINIKTVTWKMEKNKIAYLKIASFSDDTWNDFKNISQKIVEANPKAMILDLRNNPGGYLDQAVNIAGYWVGEKIITISRGTKNNKKEYKSKSKPLFKGLPTIILVNQGSASAAEILAGALQDYKVATILGEKTFGKGSVQELENLPDGSALKITVAHWYTPLNRSINKKGIEPDIKVELTEKDYNEDKDPQLDKALEMLK